MLQNFMARIRGLLRIEKGGVLVLTAICLIPLTLMLGLAIDSSTGLEQKRKLQAAVDAAARAGAANGNGSTATITAEAQKMFAANTTGMSNITGPNININDTNSTVTVSASIAVSTVFMKVGGITSSTYSATATVPMPSSNLAEVAIVYELSARFAANNFHQNICASLINFVNSLPSNVMVSITPIGTAFLLDPTTTVQSAMFNHLSLTANDEAANPAFYPLSTNNALTLANYNTITNPFYNNATFTILTSNPSPSTCPGGYASCSTLMWPSKCLGTNNTSCSQVYSYASTTSYPVLPLTLNKSLAVAYLTGLQSFLATADGMFPSYLSWGWRTIDPAWNDFWLVNSSPTSITRSTGQYPRAYNTVQKSMILIFNDIQYWNDYLPNMVNYYSNTCGNAATVVGGVNHWWMSGYGLVPVPTDYQYLVQDITCENRYFKPMDVGLGLNLSSNNYNATVSSTVYPVSILNAVGSKFFRICNNIKTQGVNIYLLSANNTSILSPCCNSSSNAYTISNTSASITAALNSVSAQIVANVN